MNSTLRIGFVLSLLLASPGASHAQDDPVARGRVVYEELYCGSCHALAALGTQGFFGPAHDDVGALAVLRVQEPGYTGDAADAAGYLRESILAPAVYVVPGYAGGYHRMPAYELPEDDLDALVAFLLTLEGPSRESAAPGGGETDPPPSSE